MFLLCPAPEITALLHTGHSLSVSDRSAVDDVLSVPCWLECLSVCVCCDLGTLVVESRVNMEPSGTRRFGPTPDVRPRSVLLPGQRGRQSGASGVLWSLGLTERPLPNKTHNLNRIYTYFYRMIL